MSAYWNRNQYDNFGSIRSGKWMKRRFSTMFYHTCFVKTDGRPLHPSSCTFSWPSKSWLHQRRSICLVVTLRPYTWRISISTVLCAFRNFISYRTSQLVGYGIKANIFRSCSEQSESVTWRIRLLTHESLTHAHYPLATRDLLCVGLKGILLSGWPSYMRIVH